MRQSVLSLVQQSASLPENAVSTEADVEAITGLLHRNGELISSEDLDGWVDQFTEDAIFMPPDSALVKGREAGRDFARPSYEEFDHDFRVSVDEVQVAGDWAFARWSFVSRPTPTSGGETVERTGKEIWIFKRQPDRSWKCSHIIYNYDSPLPSPDSAKR
jgi:uncharacterized protein (TIGR02246 family)